VSALRGGPPATARLEPRARPGAPGVFDVHVPADLSYFRGHFPGDPLLPGVVQLDVLVLAQARASWPGLEHLARVTRLRFRRPIRPGDDVELSLSHPAPSRVVFEISCGGEPCSSGVLHFLTEPDPSLRSGLRGREPLAGDE
jgi:hypothetical protein